LNPELKSDYLRRVRDKEDLPEFDESVRLFFEHVMSEEEFRSYVTRAAEDLERFLLKPSSEPDESKLMFLTKFIFSALIDADRTNTRLFEENRKADRAVDHEVLFAAYYKRLMAKIDSFQASPEDQSPINLLRREMSDRCEQFAGQTIWYL